MKVIMSSPVHEPSKMEVIMSSPVHEPSKMEDAGSNGAVKLTKSQRSNQRKKEKKLLLESSAENPDNKPQLDQNNPNNSLGTTAAVDQKQEVSNPAASGSNTCPETESHMVTTSEKAISGPIATSDANTVSKGEDDTKVTKSEIGSGTTATDNTVSKKRKRKSKKNPASGDIQSVHENTQTQDIVTVMNKGSSTPASGDIKVVVNGVEYTKVVNGVTNSGTNASDDLKVVVNGEEYRKVVSGVMKSGTKATDNTVSKGEEDTKVTNGEIASGTTASDDVKVVVNGVEYRKVTNGEIGSGITATDDTVSKKRNKKKQKKNPLSGDIQSVHNSTQTQDIVTVVNKDSSETATDNVKVVVNGEDDTKVVNGVMELGTTSTDNTVSNKRKRPKTKKKMNPVTSDIQSVDDNTQTQDIVTVNKDLSETATDDVKVMVNGEDETKVTNGEIDETVNKDSSETSMMENVGSNGAVKLSRRQKKNQRNKQNNPNNSLGTTAIVDQKQPESNPELEHHVVTPSENIVSTSDANTVSKEEDHTKVVNGETSTDNTVSNEKKKPKKKKKKINTESSDIQSVHDSTQTQDIVTVTNKDSSQTATDEVKVVVKGEEDKKVTDKMPTLGEILNPGYLQLTGPTYAKKAKRKRDEVKPVDLNTHGQTEVKPVELDTHGQTEVKARDYEIPRGPTLGKKKKLIIFDINGLLADIVSPRPKNITADYYIPKRAIFKRPYLDDFMRFCFERFDVGIWSSRTKHVLYPVVNFLLGGLKRNLVFMWDASSCTKTGMKTIEDKHKPMVFKDLRKIWNKNGPGNYRVKGTFHESNTLLVDDSPYKALINPKNTAIFPYSYSYMDRNDDFLGRNGELRKYLEGLAKSEDVKTYVEQHPFGQPAIDQTHPRWDIYAKALGGRI